MSAMFVRWPIVVSVLAGTFALGLVASQGLVRNAFAQTSPFSATVYVPSDGLAFRTFDGRVVARLSYDAHGGVFEVYDEREQPVTQLRADGMAQASSAGAPKPQAKAARPIEPDFGF